jgi:UDP:flavonoid glycosyltransferase YjiC (YdhE family)
VVHPQLFDQLWHGRRVKELGIGDVARSPRTVIDAVSRLAGDPDVADRSRTLAALLQGEDGASALAETAIGLLDTG